MESIYNIYILELENGKYYVGKTKDINIRIETHIVGKASMWTSLYKVISVKKIFNNCDSYDEDKILLKTMFEFGINNVRGGSFTKIELNKDEINILEQMLNSINDLCYVCKKGGHYSSSCKKKLITKNNIKNNINNNNINKDVNDNNIFCKRCGRDGHLRSDCNYKTFKNKRKINKNKYIKKK